MQLPFYKFIELTAEEAGLQHLLQAGQQGILIFLALLAMGACFAGFKLYRPMASAVMFLLVILVGCHWLVPAWGLLKGITFCAVVSCSLAVVTFLCFHFSAMAFAGAVTAGFLYLAIQNLELPLWGILLILGIAALAAAVLTHFFPLLAVTGFTALWGSSTFAFSGLAELLPDVDKLHAAASVPLFLLLFAGGFAFQLFFFRKQTLFKKTMPEKLRFKLEQKQKKKKGGSVVA